MARGLSEQEMAELCALADGTLPAERRAAVEARVAASPALQELLERQRRAGTATRVLADEPVPPSLRAAVEAGRRPREHRRGPRLRPVPRVAVAGALAAAVETVRGGGDDARRSALPDAARQRPAGGDLEAGRAHLRSDRRGNARRAARPRELAGRRHPPLLIASEPSRHPVAGAEEPAGDRGLRHPQHPRGL